MAGTAAVTVTKTAGSGLFKVSIAWTSDASGNVTGNAFAVHRGELVQVKFVPGAGGVAPTDLYDIVVVDTDASMSLRRGRESERHPGVDQGAGRRQQPALRARRGAKPRRAGQQCGECEVRHRRAVASMTHAAVPGDRSDRRAAFMGHCPEADPAGRARRRRRFRHDMIIPAVRERGELATRRAFVGPQTWDLHPRRFPRRRLHRDPEATADRRHLRAVRRHAGRHADVGLVQLPGSGAGGAAL
jgi:hypothetical protein